MTRDEFFSKWRALTVHGEMLVDLDALLAAERAKALEEAVQAIALRRSTARTTEAKRELDAAAEAIREESRRG